MECDDTEPDIICTDVFLTYDLMIIFNGVIKQRKYLVNIHFRNVTKQQIII